METCPKCHHRSLVYDPRIKRARCLDFSCGYVEEMSYAVYSERFELEEKNVVHKLYLNHNNRLAVP